MIRLVRTFLTLWNPVGVKVQICRSCQTHNTVHTTLQDTGWSHDCSQISL